MADAIYNKVAEFMTDTVVFTPKASVDKYNKTTFGNAQTNVSATGRLIYDTTRSRDIQGVEVTDIGRFITKGPQTSITVAHRMVVGADTFTINAVDNIADENGAHHTVIRFGR
jgi:head-tail adaptor